MRGKVVLQEWPTMVALSLLTAVVTLILAVALSFVLGAETRSQREATRCYAAATVNMLHDVFDADPAHEAIAAEYPRINTDGLNCRAYFTAPPPTRVGP